VLAMWLNKIVISHFGKLNGTFHFDSSKCNVFCADNEYGKSTLVDGILYSLYPLPTRGGSREALKPSERYKPWDDDQEASQIELTLTMESGRQYRIEAFPGRKNSYRLVDLETNRVTSIPNDSFGETKLGLTFGACLRSFLLRQDEDLEKKMDSATNELQAVVERAVSTASCKQGVSAQQAAELLASIAAVAPESGKKLKLSTVIKNIRDELSSIETQRRDLEEKRTRQEKEIDSLNKLEEEIQKLQSRELALEVERIRARIKSLDAELRQQEERKKRHQEKLAESERLASYARFSPERFAQLQKICGELEQRSKVLNQMREKFHREIEEPLAALEKELSYVSPTSFELTEAQSDRLNLLVLNLVTQRNEIAELEKNIEEMEAALRAQGVDVEAILSLEDRLRALSQDELRLIIGGHQKQRAELERKQSEALQRRSEAQLATQNAESKIAKQRTRAWIAWLIALVMAAGGIAAFISHQSILGLGGLAVALVSTIFGILYGVRAAQIRDVNLRAARMELTSAESEATMYRHQLSELNATVDRIRAKAQIATAEMLELEHYAEFSAQASRVVGERRRLEKVREAYQRNINDAVEIAMLFDSGIGNSPSLEELDRVSKKIERFLECRKDQERLLARRDTEAQQIEAEKQAIQTLSRRATEILDSVNTPGDSLAERVQRYGENCRFAARYEQIQAELKSYQILSPDDEQRLREEREQLSQRLNELLEAHFEYKAVPVSLRSSALIDQELASVRKTIEEKKKEHQTLLLQCDRVLEEYREKMPQLIERKANLEDTLEKYMRTQEAAELARSVILALNEDVARDWQRELKIRLEKILPRLLPHYDQPGVLDNLELTLRDRATNKILQGNKDLGYLSKGTRDQLNLALRLAIGDVLSPQCGPLPLILDEPFAHWDDDRFVQGLRFLVELARERQVILLTCHRWRYDRLREDYAQLYNELFFVTES